MSGREVYSSIDSAKISKKNKEIIKQYIDTLNSKGVRPATIQNNVDSMVFVSKLINKDFKTLEASDIVNFLQVLDDYEHTGRGKKGKLSDSSKQQRKSALKTILNFVGKSDVAKQIKLKVCRNERTPDSILTDDDFEKMMCFVNNFKDASIVCVLYESGVRLGELTTCTIDNLQFDNEGRKASLTVTGKTGTRSVPLEVSIPYLKKWLTQHPYNGAGDKPLWVANKRNGEGEYVAISGFVIRSMLIKLAKQAGITKKVNPHSFRHARATRLATRFNNEQLKKFMGWTKNSNMAQTYCHIADEDIAEAIHEVNQTMKPCKYCSSCGCKLSFDANFCSSCGKPQH